MQDSYQRLSEECLGALYTALFMKYDELFNIYDLCDPEFDDDIVDSMNNELEILEEEIMVIQEILIGRGWTLGETDGPKPRTKLEIL